MTKSEEAYKTKLKRISVNKASQLSTTDDCSATSLQQIFVLKN